MFGKIRGIRKISKLSNYGKKDRSIFIYKNKKVTLCKWLFLKTNIMKIEIISYHNILNKINRHLINIIPYDSDALSKTVQNFVNYLFS
jgi:hypothetical protein